MREQYIEITSTDVERSIPAKLRQELKAEADRLLGRMAEQLSYAEDIRMMNAEGTRISLGNLRNDEQAVALFRHQLEEDPVKGVLLGTKYRPGTAGEEKQDSDHPRRVRQPETLFNYMRRNMRVRIPAETVREIGRRLEHIAEDNDSRGTFRSRSGRQTGVWRKESSFLVGGIAALPGELGRTAIFAYLARRIGQNTKLLHACAARYQLEPVEQMLELYDSISSTSLSHIPDLFHEARKLKRHFVIHVGGTNTGKTHDAMAALAKAPSGVYLCPLRMLAYEGRATIQSYGVPCSFATGEEKEINPEAKHVSETIGMLDFDRKYDMAVIDECQLISGEDGSLYTNAILGVVAPQVQVCCAWSGLEITRQLISLCGDDYEVVEHYRTSELQFEDEPYRGPRKNDAYIVFSRLGAYEMAGWLEKHGMHPSIVYGKLPYEVKMEEARKFEAGETDCLVATDAIAIGQNYNIERIVFRDIVKHINRKEVRLDSQTVKQVAGRAGRYGRFPIGYVNTFDLEDRDEIREKLEEDDVPSKTAPLELPSFLVGTDLPLSLIYKAWNEAECGEPFVKADTTVEMYICRLIETRYQSIGKRDEYILASLPLDLKDRDQETLLGNLLYSYDKKTTTDEEYKALLPDRNTIRRIVKYRPHMMTLEKLCRQLDLASSFFYKIRRDDLAAYVIRLKPPLTRRIAEIMAETPEIPVRMTGEPYKGPGTLYGSEASKTDNLPEQADTSDWPVAYIYVSVSGQTERNTGRFPYGDYSRLYSRELKQSYGNEATYIDYYCYKRKTRTPDYCRFEPYFRYTVKLDPQYIVSDEGAYFLAEHFQVVRTDYMHGASPMHMDRPSENSRSYHYRNNRRRH